MAHPEGRLLRELDRWWYSGTGASLRGAGRQTADLMMPTWCVGCRASGTDLCPECHFDFRLLTRRPFRAESSALSLPIVEADSTGIEVLPVISAASYRTLVADVVVAFKDHERVRLSRVLAPALARALRQAAQELGTESGGLLIWPPDSRRGQLKRGRRPVQELVTEAVRRGSVPPEMRPAGDLIRHTGSDLRVFRASAQKGRSKDSRRRAVSQFGTLPQTRRQLSGRTVILVDDVLTTGATLHRLYAAVTAAGGEVRGAVVLAATPQAESAGDFAESVTN